MEPLRGESPNLAPGVRGSVTDRLLLRLHNPAKILNNAANRVGRRRLSGSGWVCSIPSTEFNARETDFSRLNPWASRETARGELGHLKPNRRARET
jgi:hypothetical protein